MTSKVYDTLRFLALVVLPAAGGLYFGVAELWGLPYATQVVGTLAVVDTFLGLVVKRSSTVYLRQNEIAPVIATMKLYTDVDGVPTGRVKVPGDAFDGVMFEDGKLVNMRVKRVVDPNPRA